MATNKLFLGDVRPLPCEVEAEGKRFAIQPGARGILRILRMLSDDDVAHAHKVALLCKWFYPEDTPLDPVKPFLAFLHMGADGEEEEEEEEEELPPDFDYEYDAMAIVASFQQLYGLDLLGGDGGMHWWRFRALLEGCFSVECPFQNRIKLRKQDPDKADEQTRRAIEKAQIPTKESAEEKRKCKEMVQRLQKGWTAEKPL